MPVELRFKFHQNWKLRNKKLPASLEPKEPGKMNDKKGLVPGGIKKFQEADKADSLLKNERNIGKGLLIPEERITTAMWSSDCTAVVIWAFLLRNDKLLRVITVKVSVGSEVHNRTASRSRYCESKS